ncbi:MAG: glycoside hydrolase family 3 protein, partial [Candidatus Dadabacteria bacterium]
MMDKELDNFLGLHFLVRPKECCLSAKSQELIKEIKPAGILLGSEEFDNHLPYPEWLNKYSTLITTFQELSQREKIIVAIDHEGGRVHRLPKPITHFPYPIDWADKAKETAEIFSKELLSCGINLLLGPCLDIWSNPNNKVIGPRAFGKDSASVIKAAKDFISSFNTEKIALCAKHFFGHGSTVEDSHFTLPEVHLKEEEIEECLLPFKEALKLGIPCLMTAHIVVNPLDTLPVTLSEKILTGVLREKLGFNGVILSDDLDMLAIRESFSDILALELLLKSTVDIFC